MPIYTFKCPKCEEVVEIIRKANDSNPVICKCWMEGKFINNHYVVSHPEMKQVISIPSPMLWVCEKGF